MNRGVDSVVRRVKKGEFLEPLYNNKHGYLWDKVEIVNYLAKNNLLRDDIPDWEIYN